MGLLMLVWFLSGVVMLFVRWPEVTAQERAAGLPPIAWSACCALGEAQPAQEIRHATVEDLAGRPVLRFDGRMLDLSTGAPIDRVTANEAAAVARAYAAAHGIAGSPGAAVAVERDQWTVTGYFNRQRPFHRFRFDDPRASDVYVSARTGAVAQVTDRPTRILNWLGPIPHWLYPEILRANTPLWSQVVIWTSIVGTFLTATGLYLGLLAWRRPSRGRGERPLTPYRGWMAWHHLTGLAAGLLTLTWVASGLVSMNPWGFLESRPDDRAEALTGSFTLGELGQAISAARDADIPARQVETAALAGRLHLMADGVRLDAQARRAPLSAPELAAVVARMGPAASTGLMTREDTYHFGHHDPVTLPVHRVILEDGVRFYLDPASGQVIRRIDGARRGYRWLFEAPHRLDFIRGFDRGPAWATAMVVLLIGAAAGVATGVWLGWRRLQADVGRTLRR
ncbi:MAG: hypothetical protein ABS78_04775 [Phenylobacterium sp. SCN 70-31]|nr:MAG: hypothetical protein ABS78_04775 [Phenylobacterium sp. SCN 70-31]